MSELLLSVRSCARVCFVHLIQLVKKKVFLTEYATYTRLSRFGGSLGSKGCEIVSRAPFGGPFCCVFVCVCLCVSSCLS